MKTVATSPMSEWFVSKGAVSNALARIFCFPYAGGNPRIFLGWQPHLVADSALIAVCPPGRGHRAGEPRPTIDELIDGAAMAIAAEIRNDARPVYLFGHSLGGLIAFEVARRLRHLPAVRHLVASGISAPSLLPSQRIRRLAALEGKAFTRELTFFGGLPPDLVLDDDVLGMLLPGLIADFRMAAGYRYRPASPLAIDVSLIVGRNDPHVTSAQLGPWRNECLNPPTCHWADGGHFYLDSQPSAAIDLLRALVRADQHVELI